MPAIILSDNGATSGSAGLKTSGGNDGVLQLQTTTSGGTPTTAISISNTQVVTYTNQPTYTGGTANGVLYLNGSKAVTSGTALVFDGTNLGIGVTPSAWSGISAIQFNNGSLSWSTNRNYINSNAYWNGSNWVRTSTGAANQFITSWYDNSFTWNYAGSGSSGATVSWTSGMTLDASGNLGLGNTTPSTTLGASVKGIVIQNTASGDAQLRLQNSTSGTSSSDGVVASINTLLDGYFWNYENASLFFGTNNTQRVSITAAGNLAITSGNLVLAANAGIDFSANSHATGMQTELLNDYEEGYWTPVLTMGSNTANALTNYKGRYIKIGNWVVFNMYVRFNTSGFSGTGICNISLPFTNGNGNTEQYGSFDVSYVSEFFQSIPSGYFPGGYIVSGGAGLNLTYSNPNGSETLIDNTYLRKSASAGIMISGAYSTINSP